MNDTRLRTTKGPDATDVVPAKLSLKRQAPNRIFGPPSLPLLPLAICNVLASRPAIFNPCRLPRIRRCLGKVPGTRCVFFFFWVLYVFGVVVQQCMYFLPTFNFSSRSVPTHCLGFLCYTLPVHPPAASHAPSISRFVVFSPRHGYAGVGMGKAAEWCVGEASRAGDRGRQQDRYRGSKNRTGNCRCILQRGRQKLGTRVLLHVKRHFPYCFSGAEGGVAAVEVVVVVRACLFGSRLPSPLTLFLPHHPFFPLFFFLTPTRGGCSCEHYGL